MLCIAVAPESRRLGKVDLFNAAGQCDLIELRLDRLGKEHDLKEMLEGISKPVLISCRRQADGGAWTDSEDDRLVQLRTAMRTMTGSVTGMKSQDVQPRMHATTARRQRRMTGRVTIVLARAVIRRFRRIR